MFNSKLNGITDLLEAAYPDKGAILDFYRDRYSSVYIALHPFIKPIEINSKNFYPETWPANSTIRKTCVSVRWSEIIDNSEFDSIAEVDIALRSSIHGIDKQLIDTRLIKLLDEYVESEDLICPPEGDFPALLEEPLVFALDQMGYKEVITCDEFGRNRDRRSLDLLFAGGELAAHGYLETPDKKILIATHWDSHCSLVCADKADLEVFTQISNFEGFYATPKTQVYWSLHEI